MQRSLLKTGTLIDVGIQAEALNLYSSRLPSERGEIDIAFQFHASWRELRLVSNHKIPTTKKTRRQGHEEKEIQGQTRRKRKNIHVR